MAQFQPMIAFGADLGKAAFALVRSCSPQTRLVRRRLREIAECGPSVSAIEATWAVDRQGGPARPPWALAA